MLFHIYFEKWMDENKSGAVRPITYQKYIMTLRRLKELVPDLEIRQLNRKNYQNLINVYAETHERQTTMDFHHHLHSAILDAVDEGLLEYDPARKVMIRGKMLSTTKKKKYLNQSELQSLLKQLDLSSEVNNDWLILLTAKTGIRFAEALGVTPSDFDFKNSTLKIDKTWDYKGNAGGFQPTKNQSSVRELPIDRQAVEQFRSLVKDLPADKPVFIDGRMFNSTVNNRLKRLCNNAGIPTISIHGLRHTHASLLLFAGVSIASVSKRLGHSNMTTTQQTYLHIVSELEDKDKDKAMGYLAALGG